MTIGLAWFRFHPNWKLTIVFPPPNINIVSRNHLRVFPANMTHRSNAGLILGHRMRCWSRIKPRFCRCIVILIFKIHYTLWAYISVSDCNDFVSLDIKGCICHFTKWQIHPFISKGITYIHVSWLFFFNWRIYDAIVIKTFINGSQWTDK